jgi:hypothetical protein
MHDPISGLFVKNSARSLATSALPGAPVLAEERTRRRSALVRRRRVRRR